MTGYVKIKNGEEVLFVEAESIIDQDKVMQFGRVGQRVVGEIHQDRGYKYAYLVLQRAES